MVLSKITGKTTTFRLNEHDDLARQWLAMTEEGRVLFAGRQGKAHLHSSGTGFSPSAITTSKFGRNSAPYRTDPTSDSGEKIASFPEHRVHSADMEPGHYQL